MKNLEELLENLEKNQEELKFLRIDLKKCQ